jgi:hypothetical protein
VLGERKFVCGIAGACVVRGKVRHIIMYLGRGRYILALTILWWEGSS